MNQTNDKSFLDILRDTQHHSKANLIFNKLLAKHRKVANPYERARTQIWNSGNELGGHNDKV